MKVFKYILPVFLLLGSCKKFLDVQPQLQVDESQAITNASTAQTALTGLYNLLGNDNYYGSNFPALSYLSGGDVQWTGSQTSPQEVVLHKLTADNGYVSSAWSQIYRTILSSNYIIEKVPEVADAGFTQAIRNQLVGEARFVRALAYFDLARGWGGVPLIVNATHSSTENNNVPRSTVSDTYAQVLKDLNEAERLLPETISRNKATRKTVFALKARYFLYEQQWDSAEVYASKVINDNINYKLAKPYGNFFLNNAIATPESVFELAYSTSFKNGHSNWWMPPVAGGRREWAPTNQLVTLLNSPASGGNRNVLIAQTAPPGNLWYGKLYYRNPVGTDPAYIIRIAELYLIRAEARTQSNKIALALEDINNVRDRAGLPALSDSKPESLLNAIEQERRLEFAFEADRWFNLVRNKRVGAVLGITDANKYLFPIPTSEMVTNSSIKQNPGY
jgi:hypothetical protein